MSSDGEFSVCVFFPDGSHHYVARFVDAEEAVRVFFFNTRNVAAKSGIARRVIITDGGDHTNLEWKFSEGMTYDGKEAPE